MSSPTAKKKASAEEPATRVRIGALSTELRRHIHPAAGIEPATSRVTGEVTHVFTIDRRVLLIQECDVSHRGGAGLSVHEDFVPTVQQDRLVVRVADRSAHKNMRVADHPAPPRFVPFAFI